MDPSYAAVAGQVGGQDIFGAYDVDPHWPKPISALPGLNVVAAVLSAASQLISPCLFVLLDAHHVAHQWLQVRAVGRDVRHAL